MKILAAILFSFAATISWGEATVSQSKSVLDNELNIQDSAMMAEIEKATTIADKSLIQNINVEPVAASSEISAKADVNVRMDADKKLSEPTQASQLKGKSPTESEIPVLNSTVVKKANNESPWGRLVYSLAIIFIAGLGLFATTKWYRRKSTDKNEINRIRVLSQFHLGPKKQLTIVRVAGETLLLGVTDQSINLLKALSLIDDEIPESVPQNFKNSLAKADDKLTQVSTNVLSGDEEADEFVINGIRDRVSSKIKNLRPF